MFKRKGSPEEIIEVDLQYDKSKETEVKCPYCNAGLSIQSSNGILRQGSKMIIGRVIMKCPKCKKEIKL